MYQNTLISQVQPCVFRRQPAELKCTVGVLLSINYISSAKLHPRMPRFCARLSFPSMCVQICIIPHCRAYLCIHQLGMWNLHGLARDGEGMHTRGRQLTSRVKYTDSTSTCILVQCSSTFADGYADSLLHPRACVVSPLSCFFLPMPLRH